MFTTPVEHLTTLTDAFGAPLVDFYHVAADELLFLRWYGHLTGAEIIRVAQEGSKWRHCGYHRILNDKRASSGDWAEALPWMAYEWMPQARAAGIRAMADIISDDPDNKLVSLAFIRAVASTMPVALFVREAEALRWIRVQ